MRLIALMPVRNETWVLPASIPAALRWVDHVVLLAHACGDEPGHFHSDRVTVLHERDPEWREAEYRQALLGYARKLGATHCVCLDSDEVLTENAIPHIRDDIAQLQPGEVLRVPWLQLWGSLDKYRADESLWSDATAPLAFHAHGHDYSRANYDIHERVPRGLESRTAMIGSGKGLMHLQHVSRRRVVAKQVLYMLTERLRWNTPAEKVNAQYGKTLDEKGMKLARVPDDWWGPEKAHVRPDDEPWQEAEVKRLLAEHGRERFAGVDLHGF